MYDLYLFLTFYSILKNNKINKYNLKAWPTGQNHPRAKSTIIKYLLRIVKIESETNNY